ncbi:LCP family protein [Aeromicrobium wangtongii]|uniref:LCP family protein n=1 Tax=Aeromicrobium wangtongii TaxID=2969247 RepID=UPI00201818E9|nr:LCP family protein [Aeromicrobium wangtongii]MCL3817978.1 LCP family protein [Aeromicrobium wangtongii]
MTHRASLLGRGYQDRHLDSPRVRFRRVLALCLMTIVAPGSAQLAMGKRVMGWTAIGAWLLAIAGAAYTYATFRSDRAQVLGWFTDPDVLMATRVGMVVVALLWLVLFVDAWRLGSPVRLTFARAAVVTVVNLAIIGSVAGSTAFASQLIQVQRSVVQEVFPETKTSTPLQGRYNILLVGSDAREDRAGIRPDSLTVLSVDANTGKSVMVSLPRNLQNVPFPKSSPMHALYPYGFNCGAECLLNAVHATAQNRTDLYPSSKDPGLDATIDAIRGATGLKINYYVMVNLNGFKGLVDAVGGVEMDVKSRIAMFGHDDAYKNIYIEPGRQKLNGQKALWYARSRVQSDDYARMGRQKCLMAAMVDQLSPATVLKNATQIASSGKELLSTSIPQQELGQFADLALKARGKQIRTVSIVPPEFNTVTPDYEAIHAAIRQAIRTSEGKVTKPSPGTPTGTTTAPAPTAPTTVSPTEGRAANNAEDLKSAC